MDEDYQKSSKNLTSFLFSKPYSFHKIWYEKQKEPRTSYQSLIRLPNMPRIFFCSDASPDYFCCLQWKKFWVIPMHSNFGEEGEKFQKFEWFKNQESVLGKIKAFFIFLRALILSFTAGFGNFNMIWLMGASFWDFRAYNLLYFQINHHLL